jgi:Suppressor of fused protein (SUFU)
MRDLINHIEFHLGNIEYGWSENADQITQRFQIIKTAKGPIESTTTLMTLGLSDYALKINGKEKTIRHEIVILQRKDDFHQEIVGILQQIGNHLLESCLPLLRGEFIGPLNALFEGATVNGFYVSSPAYFPDSFSSFKSSHYGNIVMVWLIPITLSESNFLRTNGWEAFESLLETKDPDLLNLRRKSMI